MLLTLKDLLQSSVKARDGNIGSVKDLYFDDQHWTVRYLVVEAGSLLKSHKVLLSPEAINRAEWPELSGPRDIAVDLNHEQVRSCPPVEADQPVSRQQEEIVRRYFGWPAYWGTSASYGGVYPLAGMPLNVPPAAAMVPSAAPPTEAVDEGRQPAEPQGDPHLRSGREVTGYAIAASDGELGHVEDFLVDDRSWRIGLLVVDTRNWWPGKKVLVSPAWIRSISWTDKSVGIDLDRATIRGAPEFDPGTTPSADFLARLQQYYGRPVAPER